MNVRQALGLDDSAMVVHQSLEKPIHFECIAAYIQLQDEARKQGFDLRVASGYRSYQHQLAIWNDKACGRRPIYDDNERPVNYDNLSELEIISAICRWSALPGASRHHWGTDIDIYEATLLGEQALQLSQYEVETVFKAFYQWLDEALDSSDFNDIYQPYKIDSGGVGIEPWHLSYRPIAKQFERALTGNCLKAQIEGSDIAFRQTILNNIEMLYQRYVNLND